MRQIQSFKASVSVLLVAAALVGCDPSFTSSAQDAAPIRVLGLPAGIGAGYGQQIVTATDSKSEFTMAFVSAKNVASYGMYNIWRDGRLAVTDDGDPLGAGCGSCNPRNIGDDVFGVGAFVTEKNGETTICGAAPELGCADGNNETCERLRGVGLNCGGAEGVVDDLLTGDTEDGMKIGRAFAALHDARLLSVDNDKGALLSIEPERTLLQQVDAVGFDVTEEFGSLMVSSVIDEVSWVAAKDGDRVAILRIVDTSSNRKGLTATRVGCLDVKANAMAIQDLDGDGLPEVFVGTTKGVSLFDGDSLGTSCSEGAKAAQSIKCDDFTAANLVGDCGDDGASVAVGDINGDGEYELIVGLPGTTVRGKVGAGAVFAVALKAGSEDADDAGNAAAADAGESDAGFDIEPDTTGPSIDTDTMVGMVDSDPDADGLLGYSVAAARTFPKAGPRDEILAGSPGERAAFLFLCSGFDGDKPAKGFTSKCQPK